MRRKVWAFSTVVLMLLTATGTAAAQNGKSSTQKGSAPNGTPFTALQTQIDSLYQQVERVSSDTASQNDLLSVLGGAVLSLQARIATAEASIEELQAHDVFLEQWLSVLDSRWRDAEARLAEQQDSLQTLIDADRALQELVAALELQADQLEIRLATLEGEVSAHTSSMLSELAAVNAQLEALQLEIAGKQTAIAEACSPGSSIRQVSPTGAVTCESHTGGGVAGRLVTSEFSDTFKSAAPNGGVASSSMLCPSGYVPTGGGYHKSSTGGNVYLDVPVTNGWMVSVQNPTELTVVVRAFTRCAVLMP